MAHPQQTTFIKNLSTWLPQYFSNSKVLEIGSLNINGTIRDYFTNCDYTGIDVGPGPGVDVVCCGSEYKSEVLFNVTVSTECFEHNPRWQETFQNMIDLTVSSGLVIVTVASTGRPEHGTNRTSPGDSPHTSGVDYYKNLTVKDFAVNWNLEEIFSEFRFEYYSGVSDLYFLGTKR
jgi:hypothetical protein